MNSKNNPLALLIRGTPFEKKEVKLAETPNLQLASLLKKRPAPAPEETQLNAEKKLKTDSEKPSTNNNLRNGGNSSHETNFNDIKSLLIQKRTEKKASASDSFDSFPGSKGLLGKERPILLSKDNQGGQSKISMPLGGAILEKQSNLQSSRILIEPLPTDAVSKKHERSFTIEEEGESEEDFVNEYQKKINAKLKEREMQRQKEKELEKLNGDKQSWRNSLLAQKPETLQETNNANPKIVVSNDSIALAGNKIKLKLFPDMKAPFSFNLKPDENPLRKTQDILKEDALKKIPKIEINLDVDVEDVDEELVEEKLGPNKDGKSLFWNLPEWKNLQLNNFYQPVKKNKISFKIPQNFESNKKSESAPTIIYL